MGHPPPYLYVFFFLSLHSLLSATSLPFSRHSTVIDFALLGFALLAPPTDLRVTPPLEYPITLKKKNHHSDLIETTTAATSEYNPTSNLFSTNRPLLHSTHTHTTLPCCCQSYGHPGMVHSTCVYSPSSHSHSTSARAVASTTHSGSSHGMCSTFSFAVSFRAQGQSSPL